MTTRILKFYGSGYGSTPASISVAQNGINVYTGTIPTTNAPESRLVNDQVVLFESEITVDFEGQIPMSIDVTSGIVVFAFIDANYCVVYNPVYTSEQLEILESSSSSSAEKIAIYSSVAVPPFSSEELAILETGTALEQQAVLQSHRASVEINQGPDYFSRVISGDSRSNVYIDGSLQSVPSPRPDGESGTWFWEVGQGSNFSYNLNVKAGKE
jgi:hypothetical protein